MSPPVAPLWARIAARGTGAWILAGAVAKALLGTPADLPEIVRKAPLPIGTTFALALGIEAFVGVATLLRPGRAWPLAEALLVAFSVVLATQMAAGAHSCGCFGPTMPIPPAVMFGIDLGFTALLAVSRPWRLARGGRGDLVAAVAALAIGVGLPLAANREATGGGANGTGLRSWAALDLPSWKGKRIRETELAKWTDLEGARDGTWLFYRESCEVCAACLEWMAGDELRETELTLVLLGEKPTGVPPKVHRLPTGPLVKRIVLSDTVDWILTAPGRLVVEDGVVKSAEVGIKAEDCR